MPSRTTPSGQTRMPGPEATRSSSSKATATPWRRLVAGVAIATALVVLGPPVLELALPDTERELVGVNAGALTSVDVRFTNDHDQLTLAGQLFLPHGPGPHPAAALINGSGPSVRDNRWYLTISAHLVDQGYAVLWPDKRGSGHSEGDWRTAGFEALARDASASIAFLNAHPQVTPNQIGIIGMSQGGRIASLVAAEHDDLTYAVSFVGGVLPMYDSLRYEEMHNLRQMGFLPGISDAIARPSSWAIVNVAQDEFWQAIGNFDPMPHWADVAVPVLFQFGAEDTNVDTISSLQRLDTLQRTNFHIEVYQGSGHALEQPPERGDALIRPDALRDLTTFITEATTQR